MGKRIFYKTLLRVRILHHYHLDDGLQPFDDTPQVEKQQLQQYNWKEYLRIRPTHRTISNIKNQRLLYKTRSDGFSILVRVDERNTSPKSYKPRIKLEDKLQLDFSVSTIDPLFFNYSEISPDNLLFFGNYKPATEAGNLPLINKTNDNLFARSFETSPLTTENLIKDLSLDSRLKNLGVISFRIKGDVQGHNLTLLNHTLPQQTPIFKVKFANKKTFWRYYKKPGSAAVFNTEPQERPLVKRGIIEVKNGNTSYPAASAQNISYERDINGNIINTYSETYIN